MSDNPKPIDVESARKVLRRLDAALDSSRFTAPEIIGELKHRIGIYLDEFAGHCGLVAIGKPLLEAARERVAHGHADTCAKTLGCYPCSCGHDGLERALGAFK